MNNPLRRAGRFGALALSSGWLTLAALACGGESGETVTVVEFPSPQPSVNLVTDLGGRQLGEDGIIEFRFFLRDLGGDPDKPSADAEVLVEFSTDGTNFQTATGADAQGNPETLKPSPEGRQHTFRWDAAADLDRSREVRVRVTPRSDEGLGVAATSGTFLALNDAPAVSQLQAALLAPGLLKVSFNLSDSTDDPVDVTMAIVDGIDTRDVLIGEPNLVEGTLRGLNAPRAGQSHAVVWDFTDDINAVADTFQISMVPTDRDGLSGDEVILGPFDKPAVDDGGNARENITPLSPQADAVLSAEDGAVPVRFVLVGPDEGTASVELSYIIDREPRRMRIDEVIAEDNPDEAELSLAALPTSGQGRTYTAMWTLSSDISNDREEVELSFVVTRPTPEGDVKIERRVPVRVDGNANPVINLDTPGLITSAPAELRFELTDEESNLANLTFEVSFDGGLTFNPATIDSLTPVANMPTNVGQNLVRWKVDEDLAIAFGGNVFVPHAVLRVSINDNMSSDLANGETVLSGPFAIDVAQDLDQVASSLTVSDTQALANGADSVEVTVTLIDIEGEPIPGQLVSLAVTGQANQLDPPLGLTNINGVFVTQLTSQRAEEKQIIARINPGEDEVLLNERGAVRFVGDPAGVSLQTTTVEVSPRVLQPADASSAYRVTVTVRDAQENAVSGIEVLASSDSQGIAIPNPGRIADVLGQATFLVTSTVVGEATLDLNVDPNGAAIVLEDAVRLTFVAGAPSALRFSVAPETLSAGAPGALVVGLEDEFGNAAEGEGLDLTVTLEVASGPDGGGILGETTQQTRNAEAIFALALDRVGVYTLRASAEGLGATLSESITVGAGPASQLTFIVDPLDGAVGSPNQASITVSAVDAFNNPNEDFGQGVVLSLGNNPTGASLSGGTPSEVIDGEARFDEVLISKAGASYTLLARADGIAPAESAPFNVGLFLDGGDRIVGPSPVDVGSADLNNDGTQDIVVANLDQVGGALSYFAGEGNGEFRSVASQLLGVTPIGLELMELSGDNIEDVALVSYELNTDRTIVNIFTSSGDGGFQTTTTRSTGGQPHALASGRLNDDNISDLVVALNDGALAIFPGTNAGLVSNAVIIPIQGAINLTALAVADFNGDDFLDIAALDQVAPSEGRLWILDGQAGLSFAQPRQTRIGPGPVAIGVGRLNNDALPDIVTVNAQTLTILANIGEGRFTSLSSPVLEGTPTAIALADFDDNQTIDMAVTLADNAEVALFLGSGFGDFALIAPSNVGGNPSALVARDFDGDLSIDLVVTNRDTNSASILLNAIP